MTESCLMPGLDFREFQLGSDNNGSGTVRNTDDQISGNRLGDRDGAISTMRSAATKQALRIMFVSPV